MIDFDLKLRSGQRSFYQRHKTLIWLGATVLLVVLAVAIPRMRRQAVTEDPQLPVGHGVEKVPLNDPAPPEPDRVVERPPEPPPEQHPPQPSDAGKELMAQAEALERQERYLDARELYFRVLARSRDDAVRYRTEAKLGALNILLTMAPANTPEKVTYTVRPGDTLQKLANRHGTTVQLIRESNGIKGDLIRVGDLLRIFSGVFRVEVSKTRNELLVTMNDRFFKRYRVGTGKFGKTPVGTFVISDKIAKPDWWQPNGDVVHYGTKDNVLGTRWLALKPTGNTDPVRGYGIHGTWEPDTIGKQASAGCVRLVNDEVEELYTVLPVGTPVTIVE